MAWANCAWAASSSPPAGQSRSTPGVVSAAPRTSGGRGSRRVGRHRKSRGPAGVTVPASNAAKRRSVAAPDSNPCAVQRVTWGPPSASGAMSANGSLGRGAQPRESPSSRSSAAAARIRQLPTQAQWQAVERLHQGSEQTCPRGSERVRAGGEPQAGLPGDGVHTAEQPCPAIADLVVPPDDRARERKRRALHIAGREPPQPSCPPPPPLPPPPPPPPPHPPPRPPPRRREA